MPTNTPKRLLAAILLLTPALSQAQTSFIWWDVKEWRQTGPNANFYLGGFTDVFFSDGSWSLSGCFHPSNRIIGPNIFCPLGTTGFIAQGDIDGDGANDQGSFWSIATVTPAAVVEPFRTDQFKILSAPPSGIADKLRSSGGDVNEIFLVQDTSVVIWYNVLAPPVNDYEITQFEAHRHYGAGRDELERHYYDVPWGTYQFQLPKLLSPLQPVGFQVTHLVAPDAYPGRGAVAQGWQIINENWFEEELQFDPRAFFDFEWFGLNFQNTLANDALYFSMRGNQYVDLMGITHVKIKPDFVISGSVTGLACNTISTDIDLGRELEQGKNYVMSITSGNLNGSVEYPVAVFGTGGGLEFNQVLSVNDISGGVVTGSFTGAAGTTLTTDRDLAACLLVGNTYRLDFTSGLLAGTSEFPISAWGAPGAMELTTVNDLSASIVAGDTFTLTPRAISATHTVQTVAGFFIEGDTDLSTLVAGGDYRIEISSGALAGSVVRIANYGFPTNFFFETEADLSGSLAVGDIYEIRLFNPPTNLLNVGDTISFSQVFDDWIQDRYDAGEVMAVDAFELELGWEFDPPFDPALIVDQGLFGPLYAIAREDVIAFPPYPIQTPPGDRDQFLLGTFDDHYELGPFFFRPGDSVTGRLNFLRSNPSTAFTTDRVNRILRWETQFIDTYEGFSILGGLTGEGFPFGTPSSERAAEYDYDRDGATNLIEFALLSDVTDPLDKPTFQYALGENPGECTATLTKRSFVGSRLLYFFEYSTDLVNWTTILPGDPVFNIVQDDDATLTVSNVLAVAGAFPPPSCFLRVKVRLN